MPLTPYVAIVFSPDLSHSAPAEKKNAIIGLQDYFEKRPEINTGDETYHPVSYATAPFLDGTFDLTSTFRAKVIHAELNEQEQTEIQRLGFTTKIVGLGAYNFDNYIHP